MRKITLLVLFCCTHLMMLAQTKNATQNETPARIKCYTTEYMAELRRANPTMQTDEQFEEFMAAAIAKRKSDIERGVVQPLAGPYVINVIVHVLHSGQAVGTYPNLSQRQVASQMRVLNEDFNRTNADAANTPAVFNTASGVAGSFALVAPVGGGIEFRLARQDPAGNLLAEAGVHRYQIPAATTYNTTLIDGTFKPATSWDNSRYMNFWTIASPVSGPSALYGYAQFPTGSTLGGVPAGGANNTDGLVMAADAFGSNYDVAGTILPIGQRFQFSDGADKGRTATHELGHGLGLRHIWGDANCGNDFCADTPIAQTSNYGPGAPGVCYTHPKNTTCAGGAPEMFMNYMDYVYDGCMNLFTRDQMTRMVTVMINSPGRNTLTAATVGNCPVGAIVLTRPTGAYPGASIGVSYTQANAASGAGTPSAATSAGYVYTVTSGALPGGLTLNAATGVISGIASATGTFNFSITPSGAAGVDANGASTACSGVAVAYSITVVPSSCPAFTISPLAGALPNAAPGVAYSQLIATTGGVAPYTYTISTGTLPVGLTLSAGGLISGTVAAATTSTFTVLVSDATTPIACQALVNYTLVVAVPPCVPTATISTFPYLETFDNVTAPTLAPNGLPSAPVPVNLPTNTNAPCAWTVINANNDTRSWFNGTTGTAGFAVSGTNAMRYTYSVPNAADDWLISPGIVMNAGQTYNVSFQFRTGGGFAEDFQVKWGNAATVTAMTTQISSVVGSLATTFAANNSTITPTTSGTYYVGIRVSSIADRYTLYIDDFSVTTTPPACATTTVSSTPVASALSYTVGTPIAGIAMSATGVAGTYTYSISAGALPGGVTMTPAGVISGIPTTATASGTFTVTATNGTCTGTKVFTFVVSAVVCPTITFAVTTAPAGVVGTAYSLNAAASTAVSYTVTPALPNGLALNATSGLISGNPTAPAASATYVVTAVQAVVACNATQSYTFAVTCPVITFAVTTAPAGVVGTAYSLNAAASAAVSYTVTPALPNGLALNATSGLISGNPTAPAASATYVVTAVQAVVACNVTQSYTFAVTCPVITFAVTTAPAGVVGVAYSLSAAASAAVSYSISPALPVGITLNTTTGLISGTSSVAVASATYVVTAVQAAVACNVTQSYTFGFACPTVTFAVTSAANGVVGVAYSLNAAASAAVSYTVSPALPAGITLNPTSGLISGTSSVTVVSATYVVTAVQAAVACNVSQSYTFGINTTACPTVTFAVTTAPAGTVGTPYSLNAAASAAVSYTVSPALPAGITLNTATGLISGNPTAAAASATYAVTAVQSVVTCNVTQSYTFAINAVVCPIVTFAVTSAPAGTVNVAYSLNAAASAAVSYTVSPALPTGITLNTATGLISGTSTVAVASATYVVTAVQSVAACNATQSYTFAINAAVCPVVTFAVTSAPAGTANVAYSLNAAASSAVSYTVSPALPAGITLNTSTGLISGTSTVAVASATYVVTAVQAVVACNVSQSYIFAINAVASGCPVGSTPVTITLVPALASANILVPGTVGVPFSQQFTAAPAGTYTYALTTPTPAGLSLNINTGLLSGTPSFSTSFTFRVVATNGLGCSNLTPTLYSLVINPSPATAIDNSLANMVKVSPNPSNSDFNVDFGSLNMAKSSVRVYDAQGKVVFTSENNSNLMVISLEKFANGIYLLEVETSKGRVLKRLAKQ